MSERNPNNQTARFDSAGIDDLYANAGGVGVLSLDDEPMMEAAPEHPAKEHGHKTAHAEVKEAAADVAEATEAQENVASETSDNRGYVNLSGRVSKISSIRSRAMLLLNSRQPLHSGFNL